MQRCDVATVREAIEAIEREIDEANKAQAELWGQSVGRWRWCLFKVRRYSHICSKLCAPPVTLPSRLPLGGSSYHLKNLTSSADQEDVSLK